MSPPKVVLLDADGVLQLPSQTLRHDLAVACDVEELPHKFFGEIFEIEDKCLTGSADFRSLVAPVLEKWHCNLGVDRFLDLWNQAEPIAEIRREAVSLRSRGLCVALASNQQRYRANHMANVLGYASDFDHLFFSCTLGFAKPRAEYFSAVLEALGQPAHAVLFIDDHDMNVSAARTSGLAAEVFHARSGVVRFRELLSAHRVVV